MNVRTYKSESSEIKMRIEKNTSDGKIQQVSLTIHRTLERVGL